MKWCFIGSKFLLNPESGSVIRLRRGTWDNPIDLDFSATPVFPEQQNGYFQRALKEARLAKENQYKLAS